MTLVIFFDYLICTGVGSYYLPRSSGVWIFISYLSLSNVRAG